MVQVSAAIDRASPIEWDLAATSDENPRTVRILNTLQCNYPHRGPCVTNESWEAERKFRKYKVPSYHRAKHNCKYCQDTSSWLAHLLLIQQSFFFNLKNGKILYSFRPHFTLFDQSSRQPYIRAKELITTVATTNLFKRFEWICIFRIVSVCWMRCSW